MAKRRAADESLVVFLAGYLIPQFVFVPLFLRSFSQRALLIQEGAIALLRTASVVRRAIGRVIEPHGLSLAQYNALRIVRGAGHVLLVLVLTLGDFSALVVDAPQAQAHRRSIWPRGAAICGVESVFSAAHFPYGAWPSW